MTHTDPLPLVLEDLSVRYAPDAECVLSDINLRVSAGEVVALAGPNGSGKTTLLRAAAGMLAPFKGRAYAGNGSLPMHRLPPERRARIVAAVPQFANLPPGFSVFQTVMTGRISFHGWFGPDTSADRLAVRAALAEVGLADAENQFLDSLSVGTQQRVLIARALAQQAPILLMDEPTAHLDLRHQVEILTLLRRLARTDRRTICIALHDLNLAARYSDRIALLDHGCLVACGLPTEVLTQDRLAALYAVPLRVVAHPRHGHPLVMLDDDPAAGNIWPT